MKINTQHTDMKTYKYLPVITGLFSACLVISNLLDTKIFMFYNLALPAGIILFPITYLFGDVLTEVYGYSASRKVIWTGFFSLVIMIVASSVVGLLPPAPFWKSQGAYDAIFEKVPRIVAASVTAYFFGEFANSFAIAKMKVRTKGESMGVRFILSTLIGELVDTTIFVAIAFTDGSMSFVQLGSVIISAWIFKVAWEIIALPVSIPMVRWLKKSENEDFFDNKTDFNPFKVSSF